MSHLSLEAANRTKIKATDFLTHNVDQGTRRCSRPFAFFRFGRLEIAWPPDTADAPQILEIRRKVDIPGWNTNETNMKHLWFWKVHSPSLGWQNSLQISLRTHCHSAATARTSPTTVPQIWLEICQVRLSCWQPSCQCRWWSRNLSNLHHAS